MFPTACSFVPFFWLFYVILTSDVADVRVENGELFIVWRKKNLFHIYKGKPRSLNKMKETSN